MFSFWKNISIKVAYLLFFNAFKNQSFIIKWYSIFDDTLEYKKYCTISINMKTSCRNCYVLLYRIILCNVYRFKFTSGYPKTIHESIHSVQHLTIRVVNNTETRFVFSCIQICLLKSDEKKAVYIRPDSHGYS